MWPLLHPQCPPGSSTLQHVTEFLFVFLSMNSILLYIYTTFPLSIPMLFLDLKFLTFHEPYVAAKAVASQGEGVAG